MKNCKKCGVLLDLDSFRDNSLVSGVGVVCNACKGLNNKKKSKRKNKSSKSKNINFSNTKITDFEIGQSYEIKYKNLQNRKSQRIIRVLSINSSNNTLRALCDSSYHDYALTFKAERAKIIKKL